MAKMTSKDKRAVWVALFGAVAAAVAAFTANATVGGDENHCSNSVCGRGNVVTGFTPAASASGR